MLHGAWRRDLNIDADTCELLPDTRHTHLSKGVPHLTRLDGQGNISGFAPNPPGLISDSVPRFPKAHLDTVNAIGNLSLTGGSSII